MSQIPGYTEDQIAHLSPKMRDKIRNEVLGGQRATQHHVDAREHNVGLMQRAAEEGKANLDPEHIIAMRTAEHKAAATRAAEQQAINARANAAKEAADQMENRDGRQAMPAHIREHVADAAHDLVQQRVEVARQTGITGDSTFIGHPDASEGQAAAAQANAEKEVADREQANNYDASGNYQGHHGEAIVDTAKYDEDGNVIEEGEDDQSLSSQGFVERGADNNGQANQTSEPTAAELLAGVGAPSQPSRKRRGRGAEEVSRAVGDGPKSE